MTDPLDAARRALELLEEFVEHTKECAVFTATWRDITNCDCGLADAMVAVRDVLAPIAQALLSEREEVERLRSEIARLQSPNAARAILEAEAYRVFGGPINSVSIGTQTPEAR